MAANFQVGEASFCDKSQREHLLETIFVQYEQKLFCDVIIKVGSKEYNVHANILAAASPYFSTFLLQDVPRSFCQKTPQIIEIQIDSSTQESLYEDAVDSILRFIYSGVLTVNDSNVTQINELARIMQIEGIESFCSNYLQGRVLPGTVYSTSNSIKSRHAGTNTDLSVLKGLLGLSDPGAQDRPFGLVNTKFKANKVVSVGCQTVKNGASEEEVEVEKTFANQSTSVEMDYFPGHNRKAAWRKTDNVKTSVVNMSSDEEDQNMFVDEFPLKLQSCTRSGRQVKIRSFEFPSGVEALANSASNPIKINVSNCRKEDFPKVEKQNDSENPAEDDTPNQSLDEITPSGTSLDTGFNDSSQVLDESQRNCDLSFEDTDNIQEVHEKEDKELLPVINDLSEVMKTARKYAKRKTVHSKQQTKIEYVAKSCKEYSCGECNFITRKVREMTAHSLNHKYEQGVCFYCDLQMDDQDELDKHMCTHQGPNPFMCIKCSQTFKTRTLLNTHLPKHFDDKPYVCEVRPRLVATNLFICACLTTLH